MKQLAGLFLIVIILTYIGCDPFPDCTESDTLPEFDNLVNADTVTYPDVRLTEPALDTFFARQNIIVETQAMYDLMKQRQDNDGTCTGCAFPTIDFDERTLIGRVVPINCDEQLVMKTTRTGNVYDAYFKLINNTQCDVNICINLVAFWMTIPKLEDGDTVNFHEGKFQFDCEDC